MIDKKHYRVPASIPDAAMLLVDGVKYNYLGRVISYDENSIRLFSIGDQLLNGCWKHFADWELIMSEPHWSEAASEDNPIPCFVWWRSTKGATRSMGYIIGSTEGGYILLGGGLVANAEPIRTEDK